MLLAEMADLIDDVREIVDEGDRVFIPLAGSAVFSVGANTAQDIMLNVPQDGRYFLERLNLYVSAKSTNVATPALSDRVFRPVDAFGTNRVLGVSGAQLPRFDYAYELIFPHGSYSNAPMPSLNAFSNRYGVGQPQTPYSAWPAGMVFVGECPLPAGSTLLVRVTPTYNLPTYRTGLGSAAEGYAGQFRVTAVATGCKRVRAFN